MSVTLLLIVLWVAIATYGDTLFKRAAGLFTPAFAAGFCCYAAASFFALATFRRQQWGWIIIFWNSISLGLSLALSVWLYREPFTVRRAIAAALLAGAMLLAN